MDYSLELKLHQSTHDLLGEKNNKIYTSNEFLFFNANFL